MAAQKLPQESPRRQPTDPNNLTICARCPKAAERGSHLCPDCTRLARFEAAYEHTLEQRSGCCDSGGGL